MMAPLSCKGTSTAFLITACPQSRLEWSKRQRARMQCTTKVSTVVGDPNGSAIPYEEEYDAIIVGSGIGSLVAGNMLASADRRVLMLENHSIPGGFTTNFYRMGYRFEVSTHTISGCERGGFVGDLLHDLHVDDRITFVPLTEQMRWIDPNHGIDYTVPMSLTDHIHKLSQLFPDQEEGIKAFYRRYYPIVEFVLKFQQKRGIDKMVLALSNIPTLVRFLALKGKTAADILDPLVTEPACRDILTIMSLIFGLCYTEIDASIFLFGSMGQYVEGAYYPVGGSGRLSRVLADRLREHGGDILYKTHVDNIVFDGNRAVGCIATDKKGKHVKARGRCVIVGCDTNSLPSLCPPGVLPQQYVENIIKRIPGRSAVLVWAGLDLDLREYGITSYEVIRNNEMQQTEESLDHLTKTADYKDIPFTGVTVYSNIDPSCCPPGKSVILSIYVASQEAFEQTLGPNGEHGKPYKALKEKIRRQFLEHMSQALNIPELEKHAEVVEVATPVTLKRYTGHREGSFMGWRLTPDQGAFSSRPEQPPIEGLFLCGQWVGFGGVSNVMATGVEAAKLSARYLSRRDQQ